MAYRLKYLGTDPANQWLPDVPASDHTVQTKVQRDELVASGLYAEDKAKTKRGGSDPPPTADEGDPPGEPTSEGGE